MDSTISMVVTLILQLVIGKVIKNNPNLANGIIFWVNWVVGILSNLGLRALAPSIASAGTLDSLSHSTSVAHTIAHTIFFNPFVLGFIQSVIATGLHSTTKNTWEMLKGILAAGRL